MADRASWLEWRRSGIGGSDVGGILGVSPWSSEFDIWHSKIAPVDDSDTDAERQRGHRLEGAVLAWMVSELGGELVDAAPMVGPEDWMRVTPDGWCRREDVRPLLGLEGKTSREKPWDKPPLYIELQCRWAMAVTDSDSWELGAYFTISDAWKRWTIDRNIAVENALVDRLRAWWQRHVVEGVAPPLTGNTARQWLLTQHPDGKGWKAGDPDTRLLAHRYQAAAKAEQDAKARKEDLGLQLRQVIGDYDGIEGNDWSVKWSRFTKRSVDLKGLVADHPEVADLIEQYTSQRATGRLYPKGA